MQKELKCKDRVEKELESRVEDLKELWVDYCKGKDDNGLYEYGLGFDYVRDEDKEGYFRYQLSWGGPSDEFRFFINPDFFCYRIEYWVMDWCDGACLVLTGNDKKLLMEIYSNFEGIGIVKQEFDKVSNG